MFKFVFKHKMGCVGAVGMRDVDRVREILARNRGELRRRFKVKDIGVFGSYVRGEQKKKSDVDVLVEFEEPVGFFEFIALEDYLAGLLGVKVDLVSRKALKPRIGERILKEVVRV
jgi:predicted nucleotidyltransferase